MTTGFTYELKIDCGPWPKGTRFSVRAGRIIILGEIVPDTDDRFEALLGCARQVED